MTRTLATTAVAILTLTTGLTVAGLQAHAAAGVVLPADRSLTPGAGRPSIVSPEVAVRAGASAIPQTYPLNAPFRGRAVAA